MANRVSHDLLQRVPQGFILGEGCGTFLSIFHAQHNDKLCIFCMAGVQFQGLKFHYLAKPIKFPVSHHKNLILCAKTKQNSTFQLHFNM